MSAAKPLLRAIEIMDVVSAHPSGATIMDIAGRTGLPKATAYRLVTSLKEVGYLSGGGRHSRYRLGPRFLRQYQNSVSIRHIVNQVRPTLRHLAGLLDEVVYLNTLAMDEVRAICAEFPRSESARMMVMPGDLFPIHATASGKVLCAFQDRELQRQMIDAAELQPYRPKTISNKAQLETELERVAELGYGLSDDEIDENVYAISVPVRIEGAGVLYSLGVNGVKSRILAKRDLKQIVKLLQQSAEEVARLLRDIG